MSELFPIIPEWFDVTTEPAPFLMLSTDDLDVLMTMTTAAEFGEFIKACFNYHTKKENANFQSDNEQIQALQEKLFSRAVKNLDTNREKYLRKKLTELYKGYSKTVNKEDEKLTPYQWIESLQTADGVRRSPTESDGVRREQYNNNKNKLNNNFNPTLTQVPQYSEKTTEKKIEKTAEKNFIAEDDDIKAKKLIAEHKEAREKDPNRARAISEQLRNMGYASDGISEWSKKEPGT